MAAGGASGSLTGSFFVCLSLFFYLPPHGFTFLVLLPSCLGFFLFFFLCAFLSFISATKDVVVSRVKAPCLSDTLAHPPALHPHQPPPQGVETCECWYDQNIPHGIRRLCCPEEQPGSWGISWPQKVDQFCSYFNFFSFFFLMNKSRNDLVQITCRLT